MSDKEKRDLEQRWVSDGDRKALLALLRIEISELAPGALAGKARPLQLTPGGEYLTIDLPNLRDIGRLLVERGIAAPARRADPPLRYPERVREIRDHSPRPFDGQTRCERCGWLDLETTACPIRTSDRAHDLEVRFTFGPGAPERIVSCLRCGKTAVADAPRPFEDPCLSSLNDREIWLATLRVGVPVVVRLVANALAGVEFMLPPNLDEDRRSGPGVVVLRLPGPAPFWVVDVGGVRGWYHPSELHQAESRRVCSDCEGDVLEDGSCACRPVPS